MSLLNSGKYTLLAICISGSFASVKADTYSEVLQGILAGNRVLQTERAVLEAESAENMAGLLLPNPEVEFAYQWATPGSSPDKKMLDVSQSFDFATLSGGKRRVARSRNAVAENNYQTSRMSVAGEIDQLMTDAVYMQRMATLYSLTDSLMAQFEDASRHKMKMGDMTALEYNGVLIQRRNAITDEALHRIDMEANLAELDRLAGGQMPAWNCENYSSWSLPVDFESWWGVASGQTPDLVAARSEITLANDEIALRRKEGLPSFSLGYTSEMIKDDNHFGVSLGVELPLWGNHGRVKAAKAAAAAAELRLEELRYMARADVETKYKRAKALMKTVEDVKEIRRSCGDTMALQEAYEKGAITLDDYLGQLIGLLDLDKRVLETERDYQQALVQLRAAAGVWMQ